MVINPRDNRRMEHTLSAFLAGLPSVWCVQGSGVNNGRWWIKFGIDTDFWPGWYVVQMLSRLLNNPEAAEPPPARFLPLSRPLSDGIGDEYLLWLIEQDGDASEAACLEYLERHLPTPAQDVRSWPYPAVDPL